MLAVLWPLARAPRELMAGAADLAVYRDQLAEVERDRVRGLMPASEAESARTEISRRLLAAASNTALPRSEGTNRRRIAALVALIGIPALALSLYFKLGSPEYPDAPLAARLALPLEQQDIGMLIGRLETRIAQEPNNGRGWEIIAPIYLRVGRIDDAVAARENAIRFLGSNAERETALGETLAAAASGKISPEAAAAFERALTHDPKFFRATYYLGVASEQNGDIARARALWTGIVEQSSANDLWRIPAQRALNRLQGAQ